MAKPEWMLSTIENEPYEPSDDLFEDKLPEAPQHEPEQEEVEDDADDVVDQAKPKVCHAYLQSHTEKGGVHANKVDEEPVYAIIGCGFAATANRSTLSEEQIGGLKVVHIGYPDPWMGYIKHNMNQAVELLTIPGYQKQPKMPKESVKTTPQNRWLPSNHFAQFTESERARHACAKKQNLIQAGVTKISMNEATQTFEIELDNNVKTVYAKKIDVCTGTGQQALLAPPRHIKDKYGIKMTKALWEEYLAPPGLDRPSPLKGREPRIFAAEMYVRKSVTPKNGFVCVTGASPAGIQALEHALCEDGGNDDNAVAEAVLLASKTVNEGFLAIGRLDYHAQCENGDALPLRQDNAKGELFPTNKKICFAEYYRVDSVEPLTPAHIDIFDKVEQYDIDKKRVLVCFRPAVDPDSNPRLANSKKEKDLGPLVYGKFDQVVLGSGRTRGGRGQRPTKEKGSALDLVWDLKDKMELIKESPEFPLGLQLKANSYTDPQVSLRVLGAAGINNPFFASLMASDYQKDHLNCTVMGSYERSLPAHARVNGEGVTLAGHTIAWANKLYADHDNKRNKNLNTATLKELKVCVGSNPLAYQIFASRRRRIGPFISVLQLIHAIDLYQNYDNNKGNQKTYLTQFVPIQKQLSTKRRELNNHFDYKDYMKSEANRELKILTLDRDIHKLTSPEDDTKITLIFDEIAMIRDDVARGQKVQELTEKIDTLKGEIAQLETQEKVIWDQQLNLVADINTDENLFFNEEPWAELCEAKHGANYVKQYEWPATVSKLKQAGAIFKPNLYLKNNDHEVIIEPDDKLLYPYDTDPE